MKLLLNFLVFIVNVSIYVAVFALLFGIAKFLLANGGLENHGKFAEGVLYFAVGVLIFQISDKLSLKYKD